MYRLELGIRPPCRDKRGTRQARACSGDPQQRARGLPAGTRVQMGPQAQRGGLASLHLSGTLVGQTLARWPCCGLPALSLPVEAGDHTEFLETRNPGDPHPWLSASSSLPRLLLACRPRFPGLLHQCHTQRGLPQEAFAGPRLCRWLPISGLLSTLARGRGSGYQPVHGLAPRMLPAAPFVIM